MKPHVHARDLTFIIRPGNTDAQIVNEVVMDDTYGIWKTIGPGDAVVDIGGHIGSFSVFASSQGARVFSYEALRENFDVLEENIALNGFPVKAYNLAVTGKRETRKIYKREENYGGSNLYEDPEDGIPVQCIPLDVIFQDNNLSVCHFLKLDCEGAETEILRATKRLPDIGKIVVETHMENTEEVLSLLSTTHEVIGRSAHVINPILVFQNKGAIWSHSRK